MDCDELVLETESCNKAALNFYESNYLVLYIYKI